MTLTELLQIGDEVIFKVDSETRAWTNTYDDVPDGTKGVVLGFYDAVHYVSRVQSFGREPGVYHRKGAVSVWLSDGRIIPGGYAVEMTDKAEQERRDALYRDERGVFQRDKDQVRLGDLPSTPFWEGDTVRVRFPDGEEHEMTIGRIDYNQMYNKRNDGSPWPFYDVKYEGGGSTSAEESWIELVERGNVWKYFHDEPLEFADLKEEASFYSMLGHTEEVRNPETDLYSWTKDEVLAAIQEGAVHGFSMSSGFFGSEPSISAQRFKDEDLGRRVAAETLKRFNIAA